MIGGRGMDTYIVDNPGDVVVEAASSLCGADRLEVKGTSDFNKDGQLDLLVTMLDKPAVLIQNWA